MEILTIYKAKKNTLYIHIQLYLAVFLFAAQLVSESEMDQYPYACQVVGVTHGI